MRKALALLTLSMGFSATAFAQLPVCGTSIDLDANRWTLFASPCVPTVPTVQGVFGDDLNPANYDIRWVVYERDESTDTYVKLGLSSPVSQGTSYWIYSFDPANLDVEGSVTPVITANTNCPVMHGCFEIMLAPPATAGDTRQNMAGHPFAYDVDWADVVVEVDNTAYSPSGAETAGFVSKTINKYNGNGYDPFDDVTPGLIGVLNPFNGFWVETLGGSFGKTIRLLIPSINQPPVAVDDTASTDEDTVLNGNVLVANPATEDSDFEGGILTISQVNGTAGDIGVSISLPSGGLLTQSANGVFSYDPNGAFEALKAPPDTPSQDTDSYDYTLEDDAGLTDTATVTITIQGVNDPPVAQDDGNFSTLEDTVLNGDVLADNGNGVDGDPESDSLTVQQVNGAGFTPGAGFALPSGATLTMQSNGMFTYNPNTLTTKPPALGSVMDGFGYQVCDPGPLCDTAMVMIEVTSNVPFPTANDISGTVTEDSSMNSIAISVTNGPATVSSVTQPTNGTSSFSTTNVLYTPNADYCNDPPGSSTDDFTYTITPGGSTANARVTVTCVNDPPVKATMTVAVTGNVKLNGSGLLSGVTDPDGAGNPPGPFFIGGIFPPNTTPQGGTLVVAGGNSGTFSYDPPPGFEGSDSFTYDVCDNGFPGPSECSTITVNLTVSDMIWFIDSMAAGGGDGRLSAPFNCLAGAGCFSAAADEAGDNIFLADGSYTGGITLLNNQKLIGDGASGTLAAATGITLAPNSMTLPVFSGTDPVIASSANGINLASGNTVRGLSVGNTTGTGITGTSVGNLAISESSVSGTGKAVDINTGTLAVSFESISSSGAANGIVLASTTGSFTITGDGTAAQNASGGTIQNTTGDAISLNNATNIVLNQVAVDNTGRYGISGLGVNNLTLNNSTFNNIANADDEDALFFEVAIGSGEAAITGNLVLNNTDVSNFFEHGLVVYNESGNVSIDIDNSDFDNNDDTFGGRAIFIETEGSAGATMTVDGGVFNNIESDSIAFEGGGTGVNDVDITGIRATNGGGPDNFPNGGGIAVIADQGATVTFDIKGNDLRDMRGDPIIISTSNGNFEGRIGGPNVADGNTLSGSSLGDGISLSLDGPGFSARNFTILIQNNDIGVDNTGMGGPFNGLGDDGIQILHRDNSGPLNLTIEDNTIANTVSEAIRFFSDEDQGIGAGNPASNVRIADNALTNIDTDNNENEIELRTSDTASACYHVSGNDNGSGGSPGTINFSIAGASAAQITQASTAALSAANSGVTVTGSTPTFNGACTNPALPTN